MPVDPLIIPRRVWLIGSMGAGKSAVGSALSALMGWPLLDNDAELSRQTGHSLTELADLGPDPLHQFESNQLRLAAAQAPPLIAEVAASVGDRPADLAVLSRTGIVVYLRARPQTLAHRVGSGQGRPWLDKNPLGWLTDMPTRREPAYMSTADLIIDVDELKPDQVARRIHDHLAGA